MSKEEKDAAITTLVITVIASLVSWKALAAWATWGVLMGLNDIKKSIDNKK